MKSLKLKKKTSRSRPLVVGTGLVALDVVISRVSGDPARYWCGGTCGNVLVALSYLGWRAQPVARLGTGKASRLVLADLQRWNVSDRFIRTDDGGTPIIVERISKDSSGRPRHSYSWRCAECGSPYPGYRSELVSVAEELGDRIKQPRVFFFDRVSPGALVLAKDCKQKGGLVVFEPSGIGNPIQFQQAWQLAHIVKYSHERLSEFPEMDVASAPRLQIETLGEAGLRFRRISARGSSRWIDLKAFQVTTVKDTAGAGDWCTAGIIARVGRDGLKGFLKVSDSGLRDALRFGQALAAWNCTFEGPRGGMYSVNRATFNKEVQAILSGTTAIEQLREESIARSTVESKELCHACDATVQVKSTGTHN